MKILVINGPNLNMLGIREPDHYGRETYADLVAKIQAAGMDIDAFDALSLAEQAGSSKAVNIVLMGRLSKYFDFSEEEWMEAIAQSVPAKFLELNKQAFLMGRNA